MTTRKKKTMADENIQPEDHSGECNTDPKLTEEEWVAVAALSGTES